MKMTDQYSLTSSGIFYINNREEVNIQLQLDHKKSTCLTGTVYNECKKPIGNASVSIYDQDENFLYEIETNRKGIYCLNILEPNKYFIEANANHYLLSNRKIIIIESDSVTVQDFYLIENKLHYMGILYGRIFDRQSRKPLKNIEVRIIHSERHHSVVATTLTNEEGQYIIYNIKPGYYKIIVQPYDYVQAYKYISVYGGDTIQKNFYLKEKCYATKSTISGVITSENINMPNVPVFLFKVNKNEDEVLIQTQLSNKNGYYQFNKILPGKYIIKAKLQNEFGGEDIINVSIKDIL